METEVLGSNCANSLSSDALHSGEEADQASISNSTGVEDLLNHSNPVEYCSGVRLMSWGGDSSSIEGAARAAGAADSPERSSARCCVNKDGSQSCVFSMSSVFLAVCFLRFFLLNRPRLKRFL